MNELRTPTDIARERWDRMAVDYDRSIAFFERILFGGGREWACSQATGEVVEIAVGTGRNLAFYPDGLPLAGLDLSPQMLRLATERAHKLRRDISLQVGDAQRLPFADASFDTAVCTLALCSIPNDSAAVREVFRVLRPGGQFVLIEHVGSPNPFVRAAQWVADQFTVRLEGDHLLREPLVHLRGAGFEVESLERLKLGIVERVVARKPARD